MSLHHPRVGNGHTTTTTTLGWDSVPSLCYLVHCSIRAKCLACLAGVIEKVQRDRMVQVNIWDEVHLNLLVPAFLYRIKEEGGGGDHMTAFVKAASITQLAPLMAAIFE